MLLAHSFFGVAIEYVFMQRLFVSPRLHILQLA
jgi:hypothetical protein